MKKNTPAADLRTSLLRLMELPDYRPLDKVDLAKALRWPTARRAELRKTLDLLEREGAIARIRKNRYIVPEKADLLTGVIQVHLNGNAHVLSGKRGVPDVFIPAAHIGTAMHGDKVVARIMHEGVAQRRGPQREGRVIRILERAHETIVGTLQSTKNFFFVIPDDPRLAHNVYVRPSETIATAGRPPRAGDKVVVKLEPWESRHVIPEGAIVEVLGPASAPGVDMLSIVRKHALPLEFPAAVLREAEKIPERVNEEEMARREDLRAMPVVTIDPDDAKDFDDAIHVERTGDGWLLGVHIADVSHYVRPGGALDREARRRGNSTYLADRVIPMLPERLSNGICSLKPNVDRLTFSAFITFSNAGKIKAARFARSVIRSAARLTYREAFAILERPPATPIAERVHIAWELASLLRRNRFNAGSLDLDFPEVKVWLDAEGRAIRLERIENDISHQLIEECMLAANEVVAREIKQQRVPSIYRIHEDPDPDRLNDFREFAAGYGFRAGDLTNRTEVQKLLASIRGTPEEYAVKLAFLKSLKRASYATDPLGHYGLAKANYTHFTSPIRRFADLVVHRVLARQNAGSVSDLEETAKHISETERTSADAEKDSVTIKKMEFFQRQLASRAPEEFRAVVVDVRSYGLVIELPDVLVSGLIHVSALPDDFYRFDPTRLTFSGSRTRRTFKLGDELPVIVSRIDVPKRQIDFVPVFPRGTESGRRRRKN
jgi:ribonuclease R